MSFSLSPKYFTNTVFRSSVISTPAQKKKLLKTSKTSTKKSSKKKSDKKKNSCVVLHSADENFTLVTKITKVEKNEE